MRRLPDDKQLLRSALNPIHLKSSVQAPHDVFREERIALGWCQRAHETRQRVYVDEVCECDAWIDWMRMKVKDAKGEQGDSQTAEWHVHASVCVHMCRQMTWRR